MCELRQAGENQAATITHLFAEQQMEHMMFHIESLLEANATQRYWATEEIEHEAKTLMNHILWQAESDVQTIHEEVEEQRDIADQNYQMN